MQVAPGVDRGVRFDTTSWSLVFAAAEAHAPGSAGAMADFCARYWYPVYAYVRQQGYTREDAEDLTQGFFERLLANDYLRDVDRARGRFRAFLLGSVKHFLSNARDHAHAKKRGGGTIHVPIDFATADSLFEHDQNTESDPEKLFMRRWALTILDRAMHALRGDLEQEGRELWFERLSPFLTGNAERAEYAPLADELNTTEGALRVAVHRLRLRFREHLRNIVAQTVADGADVDDEIRRLIEAVS